MLKTKLFKNLILYVAILMTLFIGVSLSMTDE
jgi:hypothetical protein